MSDSTTPPLLAIWWKIIWRAVLCYFVGLVALIPVLSLSLYRAFTEGALIKDLTYIIVPLLFAFLLLQVLAFYPTLRIIGANRRLCWSFVWRFALLEFFASSLIEIGLSLEKSTAWSVSIGLGSLFASLLTTYWLRRRLSPLASIPTSFFPNLGGKEGRILIMKCYIAFVCLSLPYVMALQWLDDKSASLLKILHYWFLVMMGPFSGVFLIGINWKGFVMLVVLLTAFVSSYFYDSKMARVIGLAAVSLWVVFGLIVLIGTLDFTGV